MKRFIAYALALCLSLTASARDLYDMAIMAFELLSEPREPGFVPLPMVSTGESMSRSPLVKGKNIRFREPDIQLLKRTDNLAVFGYSKGGFAVMAIDDQIEPVLGYSTTAVYDSIKAPQALKWWIGMLDEALSHREEYSRTSAAAYNRTGVEAVEPLLETKWGQGAPYNLQCPNKLYDPTGNMATGCIATAMAQIMRYWRYPAIGDGDDIFDIRYYLYADFANTKYDWNNMLPIYNKEFNNVQADAVAQLMMHCGVAVGMKYDDNNSGAQGQWAPAAFRNHFRYNENVGYRNRANHCNAEWMGSIYNELAAGRPIMYTGQDNKLSYGHAFIFDGYNEEGLVHVNWGWDGDYDGYFDVNVLDAGYMRLEFRDAQAMVMGIGMPEDNIEHKVELAIRESLSLYGTGASYTMVDENFTLWNLNDYDLKGTIALVMPTRLSTRVLVEIAHFPYINEWGERVESFPSFTYINYPEEFSFTLPKTISNGEYYAYLAIREEGRDEWQPLWSPDGVTGYFRIIKNGSDFEVVGINGQYTTSVVGPQAAITEGASYNIQGHKVNDNYRGVVIKNGQKIKTN